MRNKTLTLILMSLGMALGSIGANATPITITDTYDPGADILLGASSSSYQFTHDLNAHGFNASLDTILSVTLDLDVVDDGDYDYNTYGSYTYTTYCHWGHCHYGTGYYVTSYGRPENLGVTADGTVFGSYEIDYTPLSLSIFAPDLQNDGLLNISLSVYSGDLMFRNSTLVVDVERGTSVPEPGTLALLGLGLLGMRIARAKTPS